MNQKKPPYSLLLSSLVNDNSSLGRIGKHWIEYFGKDPEFDVYLDLWKESDPQDQAVLDLAAKRPEQLPINVSLRKSDPNSAHMFSDIAENVISYIYYDAVNINPEVVTRINENVKVLVTPSEFTKKRFEGFGITCRIEVVPLAVDCSIFRPGPIDGKPKKFTFINYGEQSHRKGTDLLLQAFAQEFANMPDVELLLVVSNFNRPDLNPNPDVWKRQYGIENVRTIMARPDNQELIGYIQQAHAFVSLTREDSFGMCGLESMACGLPVIAPLNSGYAQYVNNENGILLGGTRVEHQRWEWIPSVEEGREAMRKLYTMWNEDPLKYTEKQSKALSTAAKLHWGQFGDNFKAIIKSLNI